MKMLTKNAFLMAMVMMMSLVFIQCKDSVVEQFIKLQVEQTNKQCPVNIGNGMTMDKCEAAGGKTIKFYISVPDNIAQGFTLDDSSKATMVSALKTQPDFKKIKELEVSYHYVYSNKNEKILGEVEITPEDYK